jgi:hypothetical protein
LIDLLFITGNGELAKFVCAHGVQRVFVDLEVLGKQERQGHLDTVMSGHTWKQVREVREAIPGGCLLVRINPWHKDTPEELARAVDEGANQIMLPMIAGPEPLERAVELVRGKAAILPLVETAAGLIRIDEIAAVDGIEEVYIGLNDMHLALGLSFMFQILGEGYVDIMARAIQERGKRFGFGGIGRMEGDMLPGWRVLAEHVRLGSNSVILSRSFHQRSTSVEELVERLDFPGEVQHLRSYERKLAARLENEIEQHRRETRDIIREIAAQRREVPAG